MASCEFFLCLFVGVDVVLLTTTGVTFFFELEAADEKREVSMVSFGRFFNEVDGEVVE